MEDNSENLEIKNKIIDMLASMFSESGIDKDVLEYVDLVDDLGMDSISFISLIIELETKFELQIPDDWLLMEKFQNYSLIYDAIDTLLREKENNNVQQ